MPNPGAFEVGQRRFWNALGDQPGVIFIGKWNDFNGVSLWASMDGGSWSLVYTGDELQSGPLPFPTQWKTARFWKMVLVKSVVAMQEAEWTGANEWVFFPYSNDISLFVSTDRSPDVNGYWKRGLHPSDNLFWDALVGPAPASGPWNCKTSPTTLHYNATCAINETTYGFGAGGRMFGYLNDVYFGNNGMGGNKPNVGIPGKTSAVGDLSKRYEGFWGAMGTDAGLAYPGDYTVAAEWVFDLCDRPEAAATAASLSLQNQSEGWGVDTAPVTTDSMGHTIFTLSTSPARGTLNVYTPKGLMLMRGLDWDNDPCDTTGLVYRLLHDFSGQCEKLSRVVVTYLVMAAALRQAKRTARTIDTNVGSNRLNSLDIRGL
jgi:hypothetical protein